MKRGDFTAAEFTGAFRRVAGLAAKARRAAWLRDVTAYLTAHGAVFAAFFHRNRPNEPDWRLDDEASRRARREFCG